MVNCINILLNNRRFRKKELYPLKHLLFAGKFGRTGSQVKTEKAQPNFAD